MPRPKSWFALNEYHDALRLAKKQCTCIRKYTRSNRSGKKIQGYYVGDKIPARLKHATIERVVK